LHSENQFIPSGGDMSEKRIKVYVVEDEFYTLDSLKIFLNQDPRTTFVGGSQDPIDAMNFLANCSVDLKPNVILLDMQFRDKQGQQNLAGFEIIEFINKLQEQEILHSIVICISMSINPDVVVNALGYGVNGYLDKNQAAEGIVDAIVLANKGHVIVSPNIADRITQLISVVRKEKLLTFPDKKPLGLSKRTEEISYLFYRCGMTAKEIARELYIEESTVRTHIKKIKELLEISTRSDAVTKLTLRVQNKR
jgi:DNA-binding NarL/FixJ family response regulator